MIIIFWHSQLTIIILNILAFYLWAKMTRSSSSPPIKHIICIIFYICKFWELTLNYKLAYYSFYLLCSCYNTNRNFIVSYGAIKISYEKLFLKDWTRNHFHILLIWDLNINGYISICLSEYTQQKIRNWTCIKICIKLCWGIFKLKSIFRYLSSW